MHNKSFIKKKSSLYISSEIRAPYNSLKCLDYPSLIQIRSMQHDTAPTNLRRRRERREMRE